MLQEGAPRPRRPAAEPVAFRRSPTASAACGGSFNDPLFLRRRPRSMVPSARAQLAEPISDDLTRVQEVDFDLRAHSMPAPFRSAATIGAPDHVSAVFLPWLLADLRRSAPRVDLGVSSRSRFRAEVEPLQQLRKRSSRSSKHARSILRSSPSIRFQLGSSSGPVRGGLCYRDTAGPVCSAQTSTITARCSAWSSR